MILMDFNYVIKKMHPIHCARGPKGCKKCREYARKEKYALLDIAPDDIEMIARPMIELEINGEKILMVFDVISYFDTLDEAKDYANENDIEYEFIEK